MRKSVKAVIAAGSAVAIIGLTGAAWAYFTEASVANATGGKGGELAAVVPQTYGYTYETGQTALFPGHGASTRIEVNNPNSAEVEIVSVLPKTPASASKTVVATDTANNAYCAGKLTVTSTGPTDFTVENRSDKKIPANGNVVIIIANSVALDATADNRCKGMDFTTNWDIKIANT